MGKIAPNSLSLKMNLWVELSNEKIFIVLMFVKRAAEKRSSFNSVL